jgi:hypothetical protein
MSDDNQQIQDYYPKVPEGDYIVVCYDYLIRKSFGNMEKIFYKFRIAEGQFEGKELFMPCTYNGKKCKRRSKHYEHFMLLYGRPLIKRDRPNPKMFLNRLYLAKVRNVYRKYSDGTPMPEIYQYSVIERLIKVLTGEK